MKYLKYLFVICFLFLILTGCKAKEFTVSFVPGFDYTVNEQTVLEKGTISLPSITREGYTLDGWYFDQEFTKKFDNEPVTEDITLYAKWNIIQYSVKFMNGNIEVETVMVNHGEDATPSAAPTRLGHEFKGWDKDITNVTSNLVVFALFDKLKFEVKFTDGENQIGETQLVEFGNAATAPETPVKEGYEFTGWDKDFSNIQGNIIVNAKFNIIYYKVRFLNPNGFLIAEQSVAYNGAATISDPIKPGYEFTGWDKDFSKITSDLTVTAQFTPITYSIKYYDGTNELTHTPNSYDIENPVDLSAFTKAGKVFLGWYQNQDLSDEPITRISNFTGDMVLYGKWAEELTINYELNGGYWEWTANEVSAPAGGIDQFSNLPEIFMIDFYTYLKDNNLLTSSVVAPSLQKTTWADFSKNYTDPVAIYNWTTTNTSATTDGYSQFFYDTATGNDATGELLTIEGGFFGSEPYKTKYFTLAKLIAQLQFERGYGTQFWGGASGKSLAGFVFDGYFYGTQGLSGRSAGFVALRGVIPQSNLGYTFVNNNISSFEHFFPQISFAKGEAAILSCPSKEGYVFAGWYTTSDFTGDRVVTIAANDTLADKYYAKWIPVADY